MKGKRILALWIASLAICAGIALLRVSWEQRQARELVAASREITENGESPVAVREFLSKYRSSVRPVQKQNYTGSGQAYSAILRNTFLSVFHISPPAEFSLAVEVQSDGKLGEVDLSAKTIIHGRVSAAMVRALGRAECEKEACISVSKNGTRDDTTGRTVVSLIELGPSATAEQRNQAFQIHTDCLFKIGGCPDLTAIRTVDF
jgi:hypothetical protein